MNANQDSRSPFNDSLIASGSDDGKVLVNPISLRVVVLLSKGIHMEGS